MQRKKHIIGIPRRLLILDPSYPAKIADVCLTLSRQDRTRSSGVKAGPIPMNFAALVHNYIRIERIGTHQTAPLGIDVTHSKGLVDCGSVLLLVSVVTGSILTSISES